MVPANGQWRPSFWGVVGGSEAWPSVPSVGALAASGEPPKDVQGGVSDHIRPVVVYPRNGARVARLSTLDELGGPEFVTDGIDDGFGFLEAEALSLSDELDDLDVPTALEELLSAFVGGGEDVGTGDGDQAAVPVDLEVLFEGDSDGLCDGATLVLGGLVELLGEPHAEADGVVAHVVSFL